ncbi:spectrin beta chain, non-erythrocytic 5 kst isoform X2 [Rhodnius prolixus]|uniref:spectrin beta chain, non-erythrocytic 5 kst isoform X2 n=1 Tax=Rhodnius prolixus TaxID=13249 RepID=UPI003D18AFEE
MVSNGVRGLDYMAAQTAWSPEPDQSWIYRTQYESRVGDMTQREDVLKFEQGRIKALQEERLHIQKKTFTKWMNSFLQKARMEVDDLFTDLADGKKLLKLLEIISGEKLGKPNNGKMRVHKVENVNKSLAFLHTKVRLESIGAEDIVDGNPRLILGLIWTIILRFQIQEIEIDVDEENETSEKKSAKDALLLWCQRKTAGYPGVTIQDFTGSWRSGLGFNALIHSHRPDLIDFGTLQPSKHIDNLNNAFEVAHTELGIPKLLDAEDVDTNRPDEKSIMTYVASYYHTFARMKNEMKSGRRIANIVGQMMDADKMKIHYERLTTTLLEWIKQKVAQLEDRNFPNSLEGIQKELLAFKKYRTIEKPPKYKERSEIEALYFHINTQLKSLNQPAFIPSEGQLIHDLERGWEMLEAAEHRREVALRQELLRQERLEQLNYNFERKSVLREGFLKEMIQVLSDPRYGSNLAQVDATVKKHEAISADIMAREERFHDLSHMSEELVRENYHGHERVKKREIEVLSKWKELLLLLDKHRANLTTMCTLMALLREIDTIMSTIKDLEANFQSEDVGPHLLVVEDLLQKHSLSEMQITVAMGETVRKLTRQCQQYIGAGHKEGALLQNSIDHLNKAYANLIEKSKARREKLEEARNFYQFIQDHEDEEGWLIEKQRICKTGISAKDLRAVLSLQQKHKLLLDEMNVRRPKSDRLCETGRQLINEKHPKSGDILSRVQSLQNQWQKLTDLATHRSKQLQDAAEAYQFYADANEAESWLNERMALVGTNDYGVDEPSAQALLQRHRDLEGEINAYTGDIQSLNSQAEKLIKAGISTIELAAEPDVMDVDGSTEEWVNETRLVPQEFWEDEPVERIEHKTVMEDRPVAQVKGLYPFSGQGMVMAKGEVMFLLNKTNPDWWSVRKANGQDGFVPANYVREIEPKIMQVSVRRAEKVQTVQRVKKTKMVKTIVPVKRIIPAKPQSQLKKKVVNDCQHVEKRQKKINDTYAQLKELALKRRALLEDSIRLFGFFRECDDFGKWIKDKEKMLRAEDKTDNVESAKRKFEKFLTDLSASSRRVEALDSTVEDFERQGHSQLDKVKARQHQIHQMWEHLNWLKSQKEKSLEGASSVELFHRTCDEAKDWMIEKMTQLETAELGPDLKTVQALQRRHQNLERELAPVEEKVNRVNHLANTVKASYPNEKASVNNRQKEVLELWDVVKKKAVERRSRLESAVGQQIFMNSSKNLLNWLTTVKEALYADETARDVATAEILKKKHEELSDDIRAHNDEFNELSDLGGQLLLHNPGLTEVKDRLGKLASERAAVEKGLKEKGDWLKQCLDLQNFNKEADHIDTTTSIHEAFLEFTDLGGSIDDVQGLLKRHDDFENTLYAQDDRLKAFSEIADKLIAANHYDSKYIDGRRKQVLQRRKNVKELSAKRRAALIASQKFHDFAADVDDLRTWLSDKQKTAGDESYRDLNNIERKLQKHEAFESELRANERQLRRINKDGERLISENNYRSPEVEQLLTELNSKWAALVKSSLEKGRRLRQAAAQHSYNRTLEDARAKLTEIQTCLQSDQLGSDLRNCKQLLKKHQIVESDICQWEQKIKDMNSLGQEMAHEGHFDAENILKASKQCQDKFAALQEPARNRREALEESLRFHKFGFELETELGWIREHLPLASSETLGNNLYQAQALYKKHKKLEAEIEGHQPMIDKTLASGKALIHQSHPETKQVASLCTGLQDAWDDLKNKAQDRARKLELSLKGQQFFSEANEVESWLSEKNNILNSTDFGRDRDAASKLLTKHKALELELDTYNGIVTEMGRTANSMVASKHPDCKAIASKQAAIQQQMRTLQKLASSRQQRLVESMCRHEYFSESAELEQWIRDQMQAASSEDYGQDYEHLLNLQKKFDDLKHHVEAGAERFTQCEELANKLISNDSPYADEIEGRQYLLREYWKQMMSAIENRDQRLAAAGEIHRFNRDVADALSRISDKKAILSDDLGRDLNSAMALVRRHEGFENDLVALGDRLQMLVEEAARLQALYPGSNANQIEQKQRALIDSWEDLKQKSELRKRILQASCDHQRFLSQVRDLMSWASGLRAAIMTEEKVRDAASAQILKEEHKRFLAEIEAREESFRLVMELGEEMIQSQHYASEEIQEKFNQMLEERKKLHTVWQHKHVHLDQLIDLHLFLRDAKQIDTLCNSQEVALSNNDFGDSVDEVSVHVKKHDAFEKLFATQEDKVALLNDHGSKLLAQNHFESGIISRRLAEVTKRRSVIKEMCMNRRNKLDSAFLHAQFKRDVAEAESWIEEKMKKLEMDAKGEVNSLDDKIKKLQKHQAFQAELAANKPRITDIQQKGDTLLAKKHKSSREIESALDHLLASWERLLKESENRGRGLEEAQDILEFNNQLDKLEAWIRDKEMMVQAGDMGIDYEHCLSLQRKLDDVDSDMRVDDLRIKTINNLADKLIRQGRSDTRAIQQRHDNFINKWRALQGALGEYREHLAGALEIHSFNRDVDDTSQRVSEKALAMMSDDVGKDLMAVEHLRRKQDALERDMTAIEGKIKEHEVECSRLVSKYPDMSSPIRSKLTELQDNWHSLQYLTNTRRDALNAAYTSHKFQADLKELQIWVADTIKRMGSSDLPTNIAEAHSMLELHDERKAEIDGRQETFKILKEAGLRLNPPKEDDLTKLEELRRTLIAAWEERRHKLTQAQKLQVFKQQADQADSWLASKQAFLNNDDLGDSLASVEDLLQKHEAFEKTVTAQLGRVDEVEKLGKEVLSDEHYASSVITQILQALTARKDKLKENTTARRKKLQESKKLHQFLRNVYEVESWLIQKQQVASDENYRDSSNLQSKIQKHIAFEAELVANKGRIGGVSNEGESLIREGHFASVEIQSKIDELETDWRSLQETSATKRDRLNEAYQALLFSRTLEELEGWMDDVESQLTSEDHGKDLVSVANLLKRHALLENDVTGHADAFNQLKDTASAFQRSNHFMKDEIQERAQSVIDRYRSLQEPMQIRRDNLEDANLLYQLLRDIEDELQWFKEKEPLAASTDLGNSLNAVQSLQKKHQVLETEISSREQVVNALGSRAQQMIRSGHFALNRIEIAHNDLLEELVQIKRMAKERRLRLQDAVESQTFYVEASEAEAWLREKKPLLTSTDYGKDEDSVQSLMKKLEGLGREISAFHQTVGRLANLSHGLIDREHFDSDNISQKQAEIESKLSELDTLYKRREWHLLESRKYFHFVRETEEVAEWISDQTAIAASEDYGRDVEHVELLIQRFENVLSGLASSEGRVTNCLQVGQALIAEGNPESEKISAKMEETQQLWEDLKELAHARQEALAGAKQVHVFDRTADETISWIQEKDSSLTTDVFGQDLESIQALVRKHEVFQTDLAAVKEQVESVVEEAGRLSGLFPDAREHIEVKHEEVTDAWTKLFEKTEQRHKNLQQAEQLQSYFDLYRDLIAWISEMIAKVTSPELAQDVPGAEALISRHLEHRAEINSREEAFFQFYSTGGTLINQGHFLASEVQEKIRILEQRKQLLNETWEKRKIIYDLSLDTQLFMKEANLLENWITSREPILHDEKLGDSIPQVEELIRRHEDFEKTIEAHADKFNSLRRITMLEQAFLKQREAEASARQAERERVERERFEARKRKEIQRISEERRKEDERRKQEINGGPEIVENKHPSTLEEKHDVEVRKGSVELPKLITNSDLLKKDVESSQYPVTKSQTVATLTFRKTILDKIRERLPQDSPIALQKSGSISSLFGDRLKKGDVKRAESMKADIKKPKRTPSFTTRRRTQSFRKLHKFGSDQLDHLPPVEIQGVLDRKHELQSGGKKAALRSWKTFYTVLCGQLLCFFKDQEDFIASKAATSPIIIYNAKCEKAEDYTKRKHVFRLCCTDGSEFLFLAPSSNDMEDWVNKISFHAQLPPSLQLMSYDENQKGSPGVDRLAPVGPEESSDSSRGSTPDVMRRPKPPVPPRVAPPPVPVRTPSADLISIPQEVPPPLPASAPPNRPAVPAPTRDPWPTDAQSYKHGTVYANLNPKQNNQHPSNRSTTLPQFTTTATTGTVTPNSEGSRRPSESSSENEQQVKDARKDKKNYGISKSLNLFRKKKV